MISRSLFFGVTALLFAAGMFPLVSLLIQAFTESGHFAPQRFLQLFEEPAIVTGLYNSIKLAFTVASATTVTGAIAGYLFARTKLCCFGFCMLLLTIPLLIPPYILAYAWVLFAGKSFFGFWGTAWVLFCIYLAPVVWIVYFYMQRFDTVYEEAGLLVSDRKRVFFYITLPMLKPVLIFLFLLVFLLTFGDYAVSNMLHYPVFSTQVYLYFTAFYDFKSATVVTIPVLPVVLTIFVLQQGVRKIVQRQKGIGKIYRIMISKPYQALSLILIVAVIFFLVVVPLVMLISEVESVDYFVEAFREGVAPLGRSLFYSSIAAFWLTVLGFICALGIVEKRIPLASFCDGIVLFWFALPAVVLGIAFVLFGNRTMPDDLYATFFLLIVAWVIKFLALTTKVIQAKLTQIPKTLFEAAELMGATRMQQVWWITVPLTKEVMIFTFLIGFLFTFRESALTMLLYPPGQETLSVYILTQMANGKPQIIASLCLVTVTVILTIFLMGIGWLYDRKRVA